MVHILDLLLLAKFLSWDKPMLMTSFRETFLGLARQMVQTYQTDKPPFIEETKCLIQTLVCMLDTKDILGSQCGIIT